MTHWVHPEVAEYLASFCDPVLPAAVDAVRRQMSREAARQVRQVLRGQRPDHAVNEPVRDRDAYC